MGRYFFRKSVKLSLFSIINFGNGQMKGKLSVVLEFIYYTLIKYTCMCQNILQAGKKSFYFYAINMYYYIDTVLKTGCRYFQKVTLSSDFKFLVNKFQNNKSLYRHSQTVLIILL